MTSSQSILQIHDRMKISFSRGKGAYLFTQDGKKYLDFMAGIAVNVLGHCHPQLVKALAKQSKKLWHVSNLYEIEELNIFADNLVQKTFSDQVFFCNSGAEAVECGIKMVRKYFHSKNNPQKNRIITFKGAFHGRTMATISAAAKDKYLDGFRPELPGFDNVEFNNIEAVKNAITKNTAAILIEPIQGEEGIRVADKQFIQELRKIADKNDSLLFFDEVQSGMGRTGHLYAYQYYETIPDIIASAKGIGGGFPLGACLAVKKVAESMTYGSHGTTYGGNPLAMSVGNQVLEIISEANFLENIRINAAFLQAKLRELAAKFPNIIDEIRGVGMMLGMQINPKYSNLKIIENFKNNGLLTVGAANNVIRILPPLIINKTHIQSAIRKMNKSLLNL